VFEKWDGPQRARQRSPGQGTTGEHAWELAVRAPLRDTKVIEPGAVKSFTLDVAGITTLQLHIKGTRGISALLEPVLLR
jgi:hypothetical protein